MRKFKVGRKYKIIGNFSDGIRHFFNIGETVELIRISEDGEDHYYENKRGIRQFVNDEDVKVVFERKYRLKHAFSRIFRRKTKGE